MNMYIHGKADGILYLVCRETKEGIRQVIGGFHSRAQAEAFDIEIDPEHEFKTIKVVPFA